MIRGAGYGQLICDGPIEARDRHGRLIGVEHDTISCAHCGGIVFVNAYERPADIGGHCRACDRDICGPCVDKDRCLPLERFIESLERNLERERARRSYEG